MSEEEIIYLIKLSLFERFGRGALRKLLRVFHTFKEIFSASAAALVATGISPAAAQAFVEKRAGLRVEDVLTRLRQEGVSVIPFDDPRYPPLLAQIHDAPALLYARGEPEGLASTLPLAVIGTRKMTAYGERAVMLLAAPLAAAGCCIVSGLALGVDAAAHWSCLEANGLTVAVLGSGVDDASIGPRTNLPLARRILDSGGVLLSEYPPGVQGDKHRFPMRNRIIAGLCRGVIIVEAAEKSGALLTANLALQYDRDVFAVPGPITQPTSTGSNRLLSQGAIPACSAEGILTHYALPSAPTAPKPAPDDEYGRMICQALAAGCLNLDDLAERTELPTPRLLSAITMLELSGHISKVGDKYGIRC